MDQNQIVASGRSHIVYTVADFSQERKIRIVSNYING